MSVTICLSRKITGIRAIEKRLDFFKILILITLGEGYYNF